MGQVMDTADIKNALDQIAGALTAQRFLLENLYALTLDSQPDAPQAARVLGGEMLRQFNLPPTGEHKTNMQTFAIIQNGIDYMERFWISVEERLQAA